MKITRSLLPFLILSLIHLVGQFLEAPLIHDGTKPLLMPALAYYFWKECLNTPLNKFVYAALFFSWLGDCFLIFVPMNGLFFMLGLGGFLIAQIIYIIMNINFIDDGQSKLVFKWPALLMIVYGGLFFIYIIDSLGGLMIPVAIYCAVITIMGITAVGRMKRASRESFLLVLIGASLFIFSDSVIALNKFRGPVELSGPIVMSSYLAAQFLLVEGFRKFILGLKNS